MLERDHIRVQQAVATRVDLGPMLAVCGLAGGAGATTLAYLVALAAAEQDDGPVLVADTGGPSGGLAALAGVETSHSLVELAAHIAGHRPLEGGVYATGPSGVRVLATAPEFTNDRHARAARTTAPRRARSAPTDRDRLRHARTRRRPDRSRRRHPRCLGSARDQERHQPRAARARGRTRGRREGADRRTARRGSVQGGTARAAVASRARGPRRWCSSRTSPNSNPGSRIERSRQRRWRFRRSSER